MKSTVALVGATLRQAMGNPSIRRAELGWLIAMAAQWAYLVAILVYAYDVAGVVGAGIAGTLRMLPAAIVAPVLTGVADRMPPGRVLLAVHAARGVVLAVSAAAVSGGLAPAVVFSAIVVEGVIATLHRPTTMALMPALARSPRELIATNAVTGSGEALGTLVGPALGGVLLAVGGPEVGIAATALAFGVASVAVLPIRTTRPPAGPAPGGPSRMSQLFAGFAALRAYPATGLLVPIFAVQTFVRGILMVLLVAVSVELLGLGEAGVGYLNSAIGAGGLVGAALAFALVTRRHLAFPLTMSLAFWGLPIVAIGLMPAPAIAFGVLAVLGLANAILDVSGFSLLQRGVPNAVRARVFGAFEGIVTLTFGLGSLVAPLLVAVLDLRGALVAAGTLLPALALATAGVVRRADADAIVPHEQLDLLRGVPMFAPLPMTTLEQIAVGLVDEQHAIDAVVIREGDAGDSWYLVAEGSANVTSEDRMVAKLGPGDGFGEIALLSRVPRTATVQAASTLRLYRLPRTVFLEAVTGNPQSVRAGEELVAERLANLRP